MYVRKAHIRQHIQLGPATAMRCGKTTGAALPENNDAAAELTIANGGTARLISMNVSNA